MNLILRVKPAATHVSNRSFYYMYHSRAEVMELVVIYYIIMYSVVQLIIGQHHVLSNKYYTEILPLKISKSSLKGI